MGIRGECGGIGRNGGQTQVKDLRKMGLVQYWDLESRLEIELSPSARFAELRFYDIIAFRLTFLCESIESEAQTVLDNGWIPVGRNCTAWPLISFRNHCCHMFTCVQIRKRTRNEGRSYRLAMPSSDPPSIHLEGHLHKTDEWHVKIQNDATPPAFVT